MRLEPIREANSIRLETPPPPPPPPQHGRDVHIRKFRLENLRHGD